jgi:hypothetical protein
MPKKEKGETGYMVKVCREDIFLLTLINMGEEGLKGVPRVFRSLKDAEKGLENIKGTWEELEIVEVLIK